MAPAFRLQVKRLDFISAVDRGAQGPISNVALIKRAASGTQVEATFAVAKLDQKLGLVFGWALASSLDGGLTDHVDLQDDAIVGGDDLIKVAAEFMESAAASDVMHDDQPDGKIVFCMPLVPEVNAALGIQSSTHGLAIAMKPSPATFKRFVSGELKAFSIAGVGERTPLVKSVETIKAIATGKCADCAKAMGSGVETCPGCGGPMAYKRAPMVGQNGDTAAGDAVADGNAKSCADCGTAMSMAATACGSCGGPPNLALDPGAALPTVIDDSSDGVPSNTANGKSPRKSVVAPISTRPAPLSTLTSQPEPMMTTEAQKIADLEKQLETINSALVVAKQHATLTDAHRAHLATLTGSDADAFVGKSASERNAIVAPIEKARREADAAGNEIAYVSTTDGTIYRKSQDPAMVAMAKRLDLAEAATAQEKLEKRAGVDLSHFAKTVKEKSALLKAVDSIADEPTRTAVVEALKGANEAMKLIGKTTGNIGNPDAPTTPLAKFNAELATFAKSINKSVAQATGDFLRTPLGADLYAETTNHAALRDHAASLLDAS